METKNFKGIISNTSNKQSGTFQSQQRKSVYITVDDENKKILEDFGLTEYTAKESGVSFFIIKASEKITLFKKGESLPLMARNTDAESQNFQTEKPINISLIKGNKNGNDFIRIHAFQLEDGNELVDMLAENPFEDLNK